MEELRDQFEQLEQGQMSVTDYEARLFELSLHAIMILPTDAERVRRLVAMLHPSIRASMVGEVEMGTGYQLVVGIARRIEGYCQRGREHMQQDKRARFSGEFRGAPANLGGKARHMVKKGCLTYLAYVWDTTTESLMTDLAPVVREFADVFPSDHPGMPPDRDIDFSIDLALCIQPIYIPPYRMAPKELKEQLEELLAKGFVRPTVSPWGAPVLFVKNKDGTM
ncbi:uncharacterized protein [Nicotiana tomentosiformis]|uniref:uncharacterized protein n=1 Tax=Nicotiana tomentosiformis TaxID=4098 RepID=UPI00388C5546